MRADSFLLNHPPTFRAPQAPQGTCPATGGQYPVQSGQISLPVVQELPEPAETLAWLPRADTNQPMPDH